jgi:hypothetical protein
MTLFFAPLAMAGGAAMAMPQGSETAAAAAAEHCPGREAPSEEGKSSVKLSCASTCAAVAPDGPAAFNEAPAAPVLLALADPQGLAGLHPEGETPPPRTSPEV